MIDRFPPNPTIGGLAKRAGLPPIEFDHIQNAIATNRIGTPFMPRAGATNAPSEPRLVGLVGVVAATADF